MLWIVDLVIHYYKLGALKTSWIMETTKKEKQFDAVNMMRDIRDKISSDTQHMTFDEFKSYIKQKLDDNKTKLVGQ